jgi:hypothetical protein
MAIIYTQGKKELKYTGFDKVQHAFGTALEKIKSAPRRVIEHLENKDKEIQEYKRKKNRQMIERTFGSVENYEKFNNGAK